MDLVQEAISHGANDYDSAMHDACKNGNMDIIRYILPHVTTYNHALRGACQGGNLDLVKLILEYGPGDICGGMREACWKGHLEIAEFLIKEDEISPQEGLISAIHGNHIDVINYLIQDGVEYGAIQEACRVGNLDIINILHAAGAELDDVCRSYINNNAVLKSYIDRYPIA